MRVLKFLNRKPRLAALGVVIAIIVGIAGGRWYIDSRPEPKKPAPQPPLVETTVGPYITVAPPQGDGILGVGNPVQVWVEDEVGLTKVMLFNANGEIIWEPTVFQGQQRLTTTYPWIPERTGEHHFRVEAMTTDGRIGLQPFVLYASCCELKEQVNIGYVVQAGDYPPAIAAGFGVCFNELLEANPYLAEIKPGDVLNIPYRINTENTLVEVDESCAVAPVNFFKNPQLFQNYPRSETAIPVEGNFRLDRGFGCSEFYTGYLGTSCPSDKPWFHTGLDIVVPEGEPIRNVVAGEVVHAGPDDSSLADCSKLIGSKPPHNGYGRYIRMEAPDGTVIIYAHLSVVTTAVGETYEGSGYLIGLAGSTGCSTGSHLHLEVRRGAIAIDPIPYIQRILRFNQQRVSQ